MVAILYILTVLRLIVTLTESANILVAIPFTVNSHYYMQRPIGLELARRGHNVTVITPFNETDHSPNYHQVVIEDVKIWDLLDGERPNLFKLLEISSTELISDVAMYGGFRFTEFTLNSKEVQDFLAKDNDFDLVIAEQFYLDALNILAYKYSAPLILISTFGNCAKHNLITRNPLQLWSLPFDIGTVDEPASLLGRLKTSYHLMYEYIVWRLLYLPKHENLVKKYFPDLPQPVPSLYEVQKNVSLMLMNTHFSFDSPIAYLPNIVEVGGIHLATSKNKTLPWDLQKALDEAEHGVVYVNFGSNIKSSELPEDIRNVLIRIFGKLKQTVIWKWENKTLENKPKNVIIKKWMPQNDILAHPNVKVFISHGGLLGTTEAIYHGVPIIGIPVFADQYNNVLQTEYLGTGKKLSFFDINEHNLETILNDFLENDSYKQKALELSRKFRDRPMSPLDTAIFWVEYVLRHKGAEHLKNPAMKLDLLAYYMIDVILCYTLLLFVILYVMLKLSMTLCRVSNICFAKANSYKVTKKYL